MACAEALGRGTETLLAELTSEQHIDTRGGQQRAYVIAQTLDRFDIVLVGAHHAMDVLDTVGIRQFDTMRAARQTLKLGSNEHTVDDVFHNVPYYRGSSDSPSR
jgi:hypothetical protein